MPLDDKYFTDYSSFYKMLSPQIPSGKSLQFRYQEETTGGTTNKEKEFNDILLNHYINWVVSGKTIIDKCKDQSDMGVLFDTVYQGKEETKAEYLSGEKSVYWRPSKRSAEFEPTDTPSGNFFFEVCGGNSRGPAVAMSINVLRSTYLSEATRNVDEIQFFLNHMPSIFPSQMVPYLDVEFQLPQLPDRNSSENIRYLNRPSLLRFFLGSQIPANSLTEADVSLLQAFPTNKNAANPNNKPESSYFSGMEMFTTPQTLTNMDGLNVTEGRINPVKPFLPPASLSNVSIKTLNAGAGKFAHKTADLELKVHDKARLVEFSDFIRGPAGYRDVTVWLTYGWLAPRNRGEDDVYAKFINENMLVREAFSVKNASFSFDTTGQVTLKVELVSKGFTTIETARLQTSDIQKGSEYAKKLQALEILKESRSLFGPAPEGANKEMKIYQVLDAAAAQNLDFAIEEEELKRATENALVMIDGRKDKDADWKRRAREVINYVQALYTKHKDHALSELDERIVGEISNFHKHRFDLCQFDKTPGKDSQKSPDPFFPDSTKKVKLNGTDYSLYSTDLLDSVKEYLPPPPQPPKKGTSAKPPVTSKRGITSLGKIFCVFCMPNLVESAKNENIDEVQVNFYQLNESCGPVSLHSIAEFPVDLEMFTTQFSERCLARGGESMTVQEFLKFVIETQVGDNRSPGYAMREIYEPYDITRPNETQKGDDKEYEKNMAKWMAKYGAFKLPNIAIKMETVKESTGSKSKVNLLDKLQRTVGSAYNDPDNSTTRQNVSPDGGQPKTKRIKKIHIYDKQISPHEKKARLLRASDSSYAVYDGEPADDIAHELRDKASSSDIQNYEQFQKAFTDKIRPQTSATIRSGRDILRQYVGDTVPTLTIGANGSLITSVNLASKTDGLIGTNNMQGGSFKAKSTLAPNGLSMQEANLPMRMAPAQLSMTTLGCPLADLCQQFFIDFGTGTTIDNLYSCTQISHTIAPGKFETAWTFVYTDGYGKFFGAPSIKDLFSTTPKTSEPPPTAPVTKSPGQTGPASKAATPKKK